MDTRSSRGASGFPWWIGAAVLLGAAALVLLRGVGNGESGPAGAATAERAPSVAEDRRGGGQSGAGGASGTIGDGSRPDRPGDDSTLSAAIVERRSEVWVEFDAEVTKLLPDDDEPPRHQRFLVRTAAGESILVAHNLEVGDRAPVKPGRPVRLKGRFEWNDRGGVLHWTHHDPGRGAPRGWIDVDGRRYE